MFRILHRHRRLVLALAAIMLVTGWVALTHHHDSSTANHCLLCSLVSRGATIVTGICFSASIVGLILFFILPQSYPLRSWGSHPFQARAPPAHSLILI